MPPSDGQPTEVRPPVPATLDIAAAGSRRGHARRGRTCTSSRKQRNARMSRGSRSSRERRFGSTSRRGRCVAALTTRRLLATTRVPAGRVPGRQPGRGIGDSGGLDGYAASVDPARWKGDRASGRAACAECIGQALRAIRRSVGLRDDGCAGPLARPDGEAYERVEASAVPDRLRGAGQRRRLSTASLVNSCP